MYAFTWELDPDQDRAARQKIRRLERLIPRISP